MKVAIIGSRNAEEDMYDVILSKLPKGCSQIISGGATGVDTLAKKIANRLNIKYTCIRPRYQKYGRNAPLVRNIDIVKSADCVLAFWDGRSKGTRHALGCCIKLGKPFKIFLINQRNIRTRNVF
ncbi:MAG TPA: hypothetical protein DEP42_04350 [Ruminococcaceae bacterium]|nr:hypothetical protein [Oscillospiraceae bacterium]